MNKWEQRGFSKEDNEAAGRFLAVIALGAAAVMFLAVAPVVIGGFLIGLIWYGAYIEDGEASGERLLWPILTTLLVFVYLVGFFPPIERVFSGVLFTDLWKWTNHNVGLLLNSVNGILPKEFMIRSVGINHVRIYLWSMIPVAFLSFIYLNYKASGRGVFLYRGVFVLLTPFRKLAVHLHWLIVAMIVLGVSIWQWPTLFWLKGIFAFGFCPLVIYSWFKNGAKNKSATQPVKAGPIELGHQKGKTYQKLRLTESQLNHHVHIVGASGYGKSVLLSHLIKNRIHSQSGLMFVDMKADFETIRQVVSTAKLANRLNDLQIFSCGNPEISNSYNIMAKGSANQLKDRLMGAFNWSEEFYKNESQSFLLKLLRGLTALRDKKGVPFDLSTILNCTLDTKGILDVIDKLGDENSEVQLELQGLVGYLSKADNYKALQGLRAQLESLLLSDFGSLLKSDANGIDLFEAIKNKKIVYILLDSRTYGESSRALGKLILQDLKAASAKIDNEIPRDKRVPFTVVVDEFADLATEDFISFLDRARSSNIGVVVAHQEIADLSRISPEFANRLMNSTSTLFSFLQKLPDSSQLVSGIAGTRKTNEVTEQAESGLFGDQKTGMKSIKEVDEFVIHPNIVRSLSVGECVAVQKYPSSKAMVAKIKPEGKEYLGEEEVRQILAKEGQSTAIRPTKTVKKRETSGKAIETSSTYWSR